MRPYHDSCVSAILTNSTFPAFNPSIILYILTGSRRVDVVDVLCVHEAYLPTAVGRSVDVRCINKGSVTRGRLAVGAVIVRCVEYTPTHMVGLKPAINLSCLIEQCTRRSVTSLPSSVHCCHDYDD